MTNLGVIDKEDFHKPHKNLVELPSLLSGAVAAMEGTDWIELQTIMGHAPAKYPFEMQSLIRDRSQQVLRPWPVPHGTHFSFG